MVPAKGNLSRPSLTRWVVPFRDGGAVAIAVTAIALTVYILTLAPGLTVEHNGSDGGDLIAAARTLGVPHPTGYPTYTLLAWLSSHMPVGNIAYRVNLLSAVCAAAAVGLLCRAVQLLLPERANALVISAAAALCLAFSSLFWSQAVISEVYALLAFFAALLLWLLARWWTGSGATSLWLAALALGLGLGSHLTLILAVPAVLLLIWSGREPGHGRTFRPGTLLPAAVLFVVGLSVYAYLPVAARRRPPVNWGNPQTWDGFLWLITGEPYQHLAFGVGLADVPARIALWADLLGEQFGWWGLAIAMVGVWWGWKRDRRIVLFGILWMILVLVCSFWYKTDDAYVYLIPVLLLLALWWAMGAQYLLASTISSRLIWRVAATAVILALPLASLALHWQSVDLSDDREAHAFMDRTLAAVGPGGLVVVQGDRPTFALWYGVYAEGRRPDTAVVNAPLLAYSWYRDNVRYLYPDLELGEREVPDPSTDEMARALIEENLERRPVYAIDPSDDWSQWFDVRQDGDAELYRIQHKD